jgi:hypothetical protein
MELRPFLALTVAVAPGVGRGDGEGGDAIA